jgi:hypothetical protein
VKTLLRSPALWVFVVLLVAEFVLFDQFGARRITGIYPRWNDQIQYLSEAYTGHEYAREHGLAAGIWHALVNPSAQGTLHDAAAVVLFKFSGASRSAALALNMLALIAWQVALFVAVRRAGRRFIGDGDDAAVSWLALATAFLPLVLKGPWENVPGSAYDFRLDHLAMCALGVASAMAVVANGFRSRAGAIAFGVAVGLTLLTRFLTGTYFVVIFLGFLGWILFGTERGRRVGNLALAALIAAVMAGPVFWINREWVWNYYYVGHYVGPESAIRNQNFGVGRSLQFVFGWLGERHLGMAFGLFAAAGIVALAGCLWFSRRNREAIAPAAPSPSAHVSSLIVPGLAFLLAPALVLTLHPQKSEVVLSALVPGVLLLVAAVWFGLATARRVRATAVIVLSVAMAIAALAFFRQRQLRPIEDPATETNLRQVNAVADYIIDHSKGIDTPRVSVDYITDALDAQVLRVICYERRNVWRNFDMRLPTGIAEPDDATVRQRVIESDFVFLTADDVPRGVFPFDRKLAAMRPELRAWCDADLRRVREFTLQGRPVVLYQRRQIPFP